MKMTYLSSLLRVRLHFARAAKPVLAGFLVTGLVLPFSAFCATEAVAAAPAPVATAQPVQKVSAKKRRKAKAAAKTAAQDAAVAVPLVKEASVPVHRRVSMQMAANIHGARVSRIAFSPAHAEPFRLRETDGLVALRSSAALVVDQNTHEPLYDKNSSAVMPIASISKLMTAMVTLDSKAPLDEQLDVTDADRDYEKNTGSRLSVGSRLSREDMLHIALMASENRAAAALSRYFPGGRPAFVDAMNKKALELGMTDTHFLDPTGLSPNTSSARDLVKMVNAAYQYPQIRDFSTDTSYDVFTGRKTIHYASTNALVRNHSWQIGLQKTGFTNEAGECMVMQTMVHDRPVIMVLLDSVGKYSRVADAQRLHTWLDNGGVQRVTSAEPERTGT
jgi:serine-type D-Ala-D-Ala endopeptidase (penicillin-binding protein 7)